MYTSLARSVGGSLFGLATALAVPGATETRSAPVGEPARIVTTSTTNNATSESRRRPLVEVARRDPFSARVASPPVVAPPPPVAPEVVAQPTAPPLPFRYFGEVTGVDGTVTRFVERDGALLELREGESLDEYHVEKVDDSGATFLHTPTRGRQVLPLQAF